jgi:hypothetical protein
MSGVAVIRGLLASNGNLLAAIVAQAAALEVTLTEPDANVMAGTIPLNTPLPAVGMIQIFENERLTLRRTEPVKLVTERVQVTVQAKSYQGQKQLIELVRRAVPEIIRGTFSSVDVDSVQPDGVGPDDEDVELNIFTQSRDFIVTWYRTI